MCSYQERVYRLESAINGVNDSDDHLSDEIRNDWKNTIHNELTPYEQYGGEIEEKIQFIISQYCSRDGMQLDSISDIAFDKLCENLFDLAKMINTENV